MHCKTRTLVSIWLNIQQYSAVEIIFDFDDQLQYDMQNSTNLVLFNSVLCILLYVVT